MKASNTFFAFEKLKIFYTCSNSKKLYLKISKPVMLLHHILYHTNEDKSKSPERRHRERVMS